MHPDDGQNHQLGSTNNYLGAEDNDQSSLLENTLTSDTTFGAGTVEWQRQAILNQQRETEEFADIERNILLGYDDGGERPHSQSSFNRQRAQHESEGETKLLPLLPR